MSRRFTAAKRRERNSPKSSLNYVGTLHSILALGQDRGWCRANPARPANKPRAPEAAEIRFLDESELEALLRAAPTTHPWPWSARCTSPPP
jgi:hypothetical protein